MPERVAGQHATARRALQKALLDEERLDDFLDSVARFGQSRGDRLDSDRPAAERKRDRVEIAAVHLIESDRVDVEHAQSPIGNGAIDC